MDTNKKKMDKREKRLSKVEEMMARGVAKVSLIAQEIKVSIPTARTYVSVIQARWRESDNHNFELVRADILEKLKEAEGGIWEVFDTADNSSAKVGAMNTLIEIQKQKAFVCGITKIMGDKS